MVTTLRKLSLISPPPIPAGLGTSVGPCTLKSNYLLSGLQCCAESSSQADPC